MPDLQVAVVVTDDGKVYAARGDNNEQCPPATLPISLPQNRLWLDLIRVFERRLRERDHVWQSDEIRAFGAVLHAALFPEPVWSYVESRLDEALADGGALRLELIFPGEGPHARLSTTPWEYLYRPSDETSQGFHLALHPGVVLSRTIRTSTAWADDRPAELLNVLVVVSQPVNQDLARVVTEEVLSEIATMAEELGATVTTLSDPTKADLVGAIRQLDRPFDLVHLMGHGRFASEAGPAAFALVGGDKLAVWVEDSDLAQMLSDHAGPPRVVVLHTCEGGRADYDLGFAGLAPQMIRHGVQSVVGMQFPVQNRTAKQFSACLYREIARTGVVDTAAQKARKEIVTLADPPSPHLIGLPLLYQQSRVALGTVSSEGPRYGRTAELGFDYSIKVSEESIECEIHRLRGGTAFETGRVRYDEHREAIHLLLKWLQIWPRLSEAGKSAGHMLLVPETFELLGDLLWRTAFNNDVGSRLVEDFKQFKARKRKGEQFQVRISFDSPRLAALPWEFLRMPDPGGFFLATETQLVLGRWVVGPGDGELRGSQDDKVRVLMVVTLPSTPEYDDERVSINVLREELVSMESRIELKYLDTWDPRQVSEKLAEFTAEHEENVVDVVHLFGACTLVNGEPKLRPVARKLSDWSDPGLIVEAFTEDPVNRPSLVVLHLCDASKDVAEHFEQLAPEFIQRGIVAVLALQYPLPGGDNLMFVREVYTRLTQGETIGQAVQHARRTLKIEGGRPLGRQFGTPVLYLQSLTDATLLTRISESTSAADETFGEQTVPSVRPGVGRPVEASWQEAFGEALSRLPASSARDQLIQVIDPTDDPNTTRNKIRLTRRGTDQRDFREVCDRLLIELDRLSGARP